jgi:predicted GH43/DUF377 family glycosyl hydrolase
MFTFERLGLVFVTKEHRSQNWMSSFAQAPATLLFDDFVRVYFSTRPDPNESGQFVSYTGYVDLDLADPRKILNVARSPVMSLGGRGTFDEFGTYPFSAVEFGGRLLGFHGGWTRPVSVPFAVAIGASESFDQGRTFQRRGSGPVISASPNEPFIISGPKIRKFGDHLFLFYIAGKKWIKTEFSAEPVYRIRMATSFDGLEWKKEDRDLIAPLDEGDEAQASPDVFWYGDKYHMFFCFRKTMDYRGQTGSYRLGYASSKDLLFWERDDTKIEFGPRPDSWDEDMIAYPHVFSIGDNWYMLYLGNGVGRDGFGLCKITGFPKTAAQQ